MTIHARTGAALAVATALLLPGCGNDSPPAAPLQVTANAVEASGWWSSVSRPRPGLTSFPADLLFSPGSATLSAEATAALRTFAGEVPDGAVLQIYGHTDTTGPGTPSDNRASNQLLSIARAEAVAKVLEAAGIDGIRLQPRGCGQDWPVASNDTATGRTQNRRVTIEFARADACRQV